MILIILSKTSVANKKLLIQSITRKSTLCKVIEEFRIFLCKHNVSNHTRPCDKIISYFNNFIYISLSWNIFHIHIFSAFLDFSDQSILKKKNLKYVVFRNTLCCKEEFLLDMLSNLLHTI